MSRTRARTLAALALLLALAAPCAGQELTGPPTARPGQLVYLDARGADSYAWGMTGPEPVEIRAFAQDDGSYAAPFASPLPGRYTVWVAAVAGGKAHLLRHDLDVVGPGPQPVPPQPGPNPNPTPPPGPNPSPLSPMAEAARSAALRVQQPRAHLGLVAAALAQHYRAIASQAGAGIFRDVDAMLAANRDGVRHVLGDNLDAWKPALDAIRARLEVERPGTVAALKDALVEAAIGLEAAR